MAQAPDHSDLEVGHPKEPYSTLQVGQQPELYSTLQVKKPDLSPYDTQKQLGRPFDSYDAAAPEMVDFDSIHPSKVVPGPRSTILGLRRGTFWIVLVLLVIVLAAVIGGAVGATVRRNRSDEPSPPSPIGNFSEAATALPPASRLLDLTTLTSAAWNDTQGTLQQRLYVQNDDHTIRELSWNSSTRAWFTSSQSLVEAKSGSPLAAAVTYKGRTNQLDLFYINPQGELVHMNTTDYRAWDNNSVKGENGATIKPASNSSLSATWYSHPPCSDCPYNVYVAYQDSDSGKFNIVNASMSGDVQYITVPGNPAAGSSAPFSHMWRSSTDTYLRIHYQLGSGQIADAAWNSTSNEWEDYGTTKKTQYYPRTALGAPITSFDFGRGAPIGVSDYMFVLGAGKNGVAVGCWDNSNPKDTFWRPIATPPTLQKVDQLSPITANGAGHVFAFQGGAVKEFTVEADGSTWAMVGNVTAP
ncbi:MAG: hypothetical protein Q9207_008535 [Kuettlingeria erythrocarpa]